MFPLIGGLGALSQLIPLITTVVPALSGVLTSSGAGNVLLKAGDLAEKIFGTKDIKEIEARLKAEGDNAQRVLEKYKVELEAATKLELAEFEDRQNARIMQIEAIRAQSRVQWVPVVIAAFICCMFVFTTWAVFDGRISDRSLNAGLLVGANISFATMVFQFFFGSSKGSEAKTDVMAATMAQMQSMNRQITASMQGAAEKAADVAVGVAAKAADAAKNGGMFK